MAGHVGGGREAEKTFLTPPECVLPITRAKFGPTLLAPPLSATDEHALKR